MHCLCRPSRIMSVRINLLDETDFIHEIKVSAIDNNDNENNPNLFIYVLYMLFNSAILAFISTHTHIIRHVSGEV